MKQHGKQRRKIDNCRWSVSPSILLSVEQNNSYLKRLNVVPSRFVLTREQACAYTRKLLIKLVETKVLDSKVRIEKKRKKNLERCSKKLLWNQPGSQCVKKMFVTLKDLSFVIREADIARLWVDKSDEKPNCIVGGGVVSRRWPWEANRFRLDVANSVNHRKPIKSVRTSVRTAICLFRRACWIVFSIWICHIMYIFIYVCTHTTKTNTHTHTRSHSLNEASVFARCFAVLHNIVVSPFTSMITSPTCWSHWVFLTVCIERLNFPKKKKKNRNNRNRLDDIKEIDC